MAERCAASNAGKQCRAKKGLTRVLMTCDRGDSNLILPVCITIALCPKHFVLRSDRVGPNPATEKEEQQQ